MFENPSTIWIEILILVAAISFVALILGRFIYRRIHHLPTGECECCHKGTKKLLKEYHKKQQK